MKLYQQIDRVFKELESLGIGEIEPLSLDTLTAFDQFHYLGTSAVDCAIEQLKINPSMQVLEVGGGIGGPARYLADRSKCSVSVLELQNDLNETAIELTQRCGLDHRVQHYCGDILNGSPENRKFDALVSWLTFLHIPDRNALYKKCFESLKPGAMLFVEDYFEKKPLTDSEQKLLRHEVYCERIPTLQDYREELSGAGFIEFDLVDVTNEWTKFVVERRAAFDADGERNIALHGADVVRGLEEFYSAIVTLFTGGNLGGIRFTARKPA